MSEVLSDATDGRRVAAAVVVEDDHHLGLQLADVVERLVGHAAGEGSVAHDTDDLAGVAAQLARRGESQRIAEPRWCVRVLDEIVLGLLPRGVATEAALLAERVEPVEPAGQHLVNVGLVPGVEDDRVAGALKDAVHRNGELDDPEIGTEMPSGARHRGDQLFTNLRAETGQIFRAQSAQVLWTRDLLEQHQVSLVEPTRLGSCGKCPCTRVAEHDYRPCRDWSHARRCSNVPRATAISPRVPSGWRPTTAPAWSRSDGWSASTNSPASCARGAVSTGAARPTPRWSVPCCATGSVSVVRGVAIRAPTTSTPCSSAEPESRLPARPSGSRSAPEPRYPSRG